MTLIVIPAKPLIQLHALRRPSWTLTFVRVRKKIRDDPKDPLDNIPNIE
jgi:hypothetical protein